MVFGPQKTMVFKIENHGFQPCNYQVIYYHSIVFNMKNKLSILHITVFQKHTMVHILETAVS